MGFRIPSKVVLKLCIQIFLKATPLSIQDSYFSVVLPRLRGIFHGCSIFLGQSLHVEFFWGALPWKWRQLHAEGRPVLLIIFEEWFWWISPGGKNAHMHGIWKHQQNPDGVHHSVAFHAATRCRRSIFKGFKKGKHQDKTVLFVTRTKNSINKPSQKWHGEKWTVWKNISTAAASVYWLPFARKLTWVELIFASVVSVHFRLYKQNASSSCQFLKLAVSYSSNFWHCLLIWLVWNH